MAFQWRVFRTAPKWVYGYHGCSIRDVPSIRRHGFRPSANKYDWLGTGIYFWEWAPYRALQWAQMRHGEDGVVLGARIALGYCLNLLDTQFTDQVRQQYEMLKEAGRSLPANREKNRTLDCYIIDSYCEYYKAATGRGFDTVRGGFEEGKPLFSGSGIMDQSHVQLSVRNPDGISRIHLVGRNLLERRDR